MLKPVCFLLLLTFILGGCGKEEAALVLSEEDILETLDANLRSDDGGVFLELEQAPGLFKSATWPCGIMFDTTFIKKNLTFTLDQQVSWTVICNEKMPVKMEILQTGSWQLNRKFLQAGSNAQSNLTLSQLVTQDHYLINGVSFREGQNLLTRPAFNREYTHSFKIQYQDVLIRKQEKTIASGQATFNISGQVNDGKAFNQSGNLVFHGDNTATIATEGKIYTISWN